MPGSSGRLRDEQASENLSRTLCRRLPLHRRRLCRRCRGLPRTLELGEPGRRIAGLGRRRIVPRARLGEQCRRGLAAQVDSFRCAAEPVAHLQRLLARACRVGELLLGLRALCEQRLEPLLHLVPPTPGGVPPGLELGEPLLEPREVELRDARAQAGDLHRELLRPLGRSRLQRERPEPLANLCLDVAGALDLERDPRELQLGAMAASLEASEPGRFLDQRAALGRLRRENRLDLALADDRVHPLAEPEVGEQLDEVEPAHGGAVDEVLPLAAAVQPPRDRELGVVDRQRAVGVVEEELDLAEVRPRRASRRRRRGRRPASRPAARSG